MAALGALGRCVMMLLVPTKEFFYFSLFFPDAPLSTFDTSVDASLGAALLGLSGVLAYVMHTCCLLYMNTPT